MTDDAAVSPSKRHFSGADAHTRSVVNRQLCWSRPCMLLVFAVETKKQKTKLTGRWMRVFFSFAAISRLECVE